MFYITGDLHGSHDINKLSSKRFPQQHNLTKDDYLIVTGDFGLIWNEFNEDKWWLDWLNKRQFTTLFVDGNHENHELLDAMPVEQWKDGKIHRINESVIHLMRGQVFNIDGLKFFTCGGADSIDKLSRKEYISWWKREIPSNDEFEEGFINLEKHDWKVDYVITHDCSESIFKILMEGLWVKDLTSINKYFEEIEQRLDYKMWYFGHYHDNQLIDDKHILLYNEILKLWR